MKLKYLVLFRLLPSRLILLQPSESIVTLWATKSMIYRSNALWWTNLFKICSATINEIEELVAGNQVLHYKPCFGLLIRIPTQLPSSSRYEWSEELNHNWSCSHVLGDFVSCLLLSFGFLLDGSLQKEIVLKMKNKSDKKILTWRFIVWAPLQPPVVRKFLRCFRFVNSVSQNYQ